MNNFERLQSLIKNDRLTPDLLPKLEKELFFLECNESVCSYILNCYDELTSQNKKTTNKNNAVIYYFLGLTDEAPAKKITQSATTLPDIDYDTDSRDEIKHYLVNKYGKDKVSLLGTYNTLKIKGAIKDVIRQVRDTMSFEEVNNINKKFDSINRTDIDTIKGLLINSPNASEFENITDYRSEIAFYYATLEFDKDLKVWFNENPDVADSVIQLLGNAKSTGIHAGGIVVSGIDIRNVVPLTYDKTEEIWVTQPEMGDVEGAGLIKYDFLGLKTGAILNRAFKLVNQRHGTKFSTSNIPLDDQEVLNDFKKGLAISVFQFDTDLVQPNLLKLNSIDSVNDLAIITSIYRPGPLKMKMDQRFIKRKNGEEPIDYLHPSLEKHLKNTYGIVIYQESVMNICVDIGGISPSDSVVVLKAMGKKDAAKLDKFKEKFIKGAVKKHDMDEKIAQELWDHLYAFSEYGFNKSHAIAYGITSYLCMWLKHHYPLEWINSVLAISDKDDFKLMYQQWSDHIQRPDVNKSRENYFIDDETKKVTMPFTSVNGIGDKAVESMIAAQPFTSFVDFYERIDKRKVNKKCVFNLIMSGSFDQFKIPEVSAAKWRKHLVKEFIALKHKEKKPTKAQKEEDEKLVFEVESMNRAKILMKEVELLNFTSFDYHEFFKDKMTTYCKSVFGREAMKPKDALDLPNKTPVVVGGAIESIEFVPIKSGKFIGKDRMIIRLVNQGDAIEVVIMPWVLENDDAAGGGSLRKLTPYTPIIVKGLINVFGPFYSVSFSEGITLV